MLPTSTTWYLADLGEARGRQELFTRQSPQKLKVLREHALIESAISSNRIEGVEVDQSRVGTLVFGTPTLKDREEEEIRGYRDALKLIHDTGARLPISEATILRLHKLSSKAWHQGKHDSWPYINHLLFILSQAYQQFEQRVGQIHSPRGEKTEVVYAAIDRQIAQFRFADLQTACPGVSVDMIRHLLDQLRAEGKVRCLGRGRSARWEKTGN
jgi:hypothetical protein